MNRYLILLLMVTASTCFGQIWKKKDKRENETWPVNLTYIRFLGQPQSEFKEWLTSTKNLGSFEPGYSYGTTRYYLNEWLYVKPDRNGTQMMSNSYDFFFEDYSSKCYRIEIRSSYFDRATDYLLSNGFINKDSAFVAPDGKSRIFIDKGRIQVYPIPKFEFYVKKEKVKVLSELEIYELTMSSLNDYQTQFNGMRLNFVNPRVEMFLQREMEMTHLGEMGITGGDSIKYITQSFQKRITINRNTPVLKVLYELAIVKDDLIIRKCTITGTSSVVIDFYVKFWKTTLNFEAAKKDEFVVNYFYSDRIALTLGPKTKIEIAKN